MRGGRWRPGREPDSLGNPNHLTGMDRMTVLAWDGKSLAADKQMTMGGTPVPVTKIFRLNTPIGPEIVGFCGEAQEALTFLEWYKSDCSTPKPVMEKGFAAYIVRGKELWKYESMLIPMRIDMPFWAAGAGADYAIGAMAAGKSAREAVEIACLFDVNCGLGVDVLDCDEEQTEVADEAKRAAKCGLGVGCYDLADFVHGGGGDDGMQGCG